MIGMSLKSFHLEAEYYTQKFRISLSVSDTVVITAPDRGRHSQVKMPLFVRTSRDAEYAPQHT